MKVVWSAQAESDRASIIDYIFADNLDAALNLDVDISDTVQLLEKFPLSGRPGREAETREVIIGNYILAYEVHHDHIDILQIVHGARQYPLVKRSD